MSERVTNYYARFWAPGAFVADDWTCPVASLDPNAVKWPEHAYAFTLHKRVDLHDGPEVFQGKPEQIGPTYYHPDSKVETLEEVKLNPNKGRALVRNMEGFGWARVVWSRWGHWPQPFDPAKDEVLPRSNEAAKNLGSNDAAR